MMPNPKRISSVSVLLECGLKYMVVQLVFNGTVGAQFYDWIVVGVNNNDKCRLKGNGQTQYIIEIPVIDDPCGTKMVCDCARPKQSSVLMCSNCFADSGENVRECDKNRPESKDHSEGR